MLLTTPAIVLSVIKYNDTDAVIKAYTAQTGFTAFFIRGFFKGRKSRSRKAIFQPGALVELVFNFKNKGQLEHLKETRLLYHYKTLYQNFDKLNIATFLREVLLESLKNEQGDAGLFQFIFKKFVALDQEKFYPDFHLIFLLQLTRYLGFFPDLQSEGVYFDLQNAVFTMQIPLNPYLTEAETRLFRNFSGMIFATKKNIKITQLDRKKLIDILLRFYRYHITQFNMPKSVKVLHQIYE